MDIIGKADPYVIFQLSSSRQAFRTSTKKNTYAAVWNEYFRVNVANPERDILHLSLKDSDTISEDDLISRLEIPLSTLPIGAVVEKEFHPVPAPDVPKGGRLFLKLQVAKAGSDPFVEQTPAPSPIPQPSSPPQPSYPPQPGIAPQPSYPPQPGIAQQPPYPPQPGIAPQPPYPPQPGYMWQPGYPQGYPAGPGHPYPPPNYPPQPGYGYPQAPPGMQRHATQPYVGALPDRQPGRLVGAFSGSSPSIGYPAYPPR
jgi:hypothetical protein